MADEAYLRCGIPDDPLKLPDKGVDIYPDDEGLFILKETIMMSKFDKKAYISCNLRCSTPDLRPG
ncbi:MAG: hypothetical protein JW705_06235 [Methanosarcinaceae archaeon]|nr:hypothetical protein [Methanosarcinaceae archaeon]